MKKLLPLLFILVCTVASADTAYVTDELKINMRSGNTGRNKIIRMIPSGAKLTVISRSKATGYSKVRYKSTEGYVLSRFLQKKQVSKFFLKDAQETAGNLNVENVRLSKELTELTGNNTSTLSTNQNLTEERNHLRNELNELQHTAANAIQLKNERNQFQERIISIERELEQLRLEKKVLEDTSKQDWFLYGGILALAGMLMGWILPKLSWQRKTSNWDSF